MQKDDPQKPAGQQPEEQGAPDMHSSKDHHESQGGQGGLSTDKDKNTQHDQGGERSIAGREDS
ncbi:MAG TPA: hypothetical protein VK927_08350 [Adhaeribacter sp.]|nr:hypothetical protein [Adhaeribacter sp.]